MPPDGVHTFSATRFLLFLHSVPYLGEKTLTRMLRWNALHRVTPEECLALTPAEWQTRYDLDPRAVASLRDHRETLLAQSAELLRALHAHPLHLLTVESRTYPARLERYDDAPPPILYALGNAALLQDREMDTSGRFTFTTALSNGATAASLAKQEEIAAVLVEAGGIPVTGHDRTPYKRLALVAQRQNRSICYVLDRGLREALGPQFDRPPFAAARIRDAVFEVTRDVAVSPFRLDDHMLGSNNRRRDRMVFALADLVVAVDVAPGGGMEAECRRAQEQGKPLIIASGGREGNARLREIARRPGANGTATTVCLATENETKTEIMRLLDSRQPQEAEASSAFLYPLSNKR